MHKNELEELFDSLILFQLTKEVPIVDAIEQIGKLIDVSDVLGKVEGTSHGIDLIEQCQDRSITSMESALLHYFCSNAWSDLQKYSRKESNADWDWEQVELEKQIFHLRMAVKEHGFKELDAFRKCQVFTNLGNLYSHIGRFVEAIEYWDRALAVNPKFGMALINKGYGLEIYARSLYDKGQQQIFLKQAYAKLKAGLASGVESHAIDGVEQLIEKIENYFSQENLNKVISLKDYSLGKSKAEQKYRKWCLRSCLFLNPLNGVFEHTIASHDCFTVPSIVAGENEGPVFHGFYNQLKQEFVSARFLLYEGIEARGNHYADRDVKLHNVFDYTAYSLSVEKVKIAYRMTYSLFDKIAKMLNFYLDLGIKDRSISFRTIWYEKQNRNKGLKKNFAQCRNLSFRGLFWLSKDFYEDKTGFREVIEPEAANLREIRNHAEHKHLKVHDENWLPHLSNPLSYDPTAYSIRRDEIEDKAVRLLKIARAALIYLSLGIHQEEINRLEGSEKLIVPLSLGFYDDKWKT